jgi:microcystin-dependent protein
VVYVPPGTIMSSLTHNSLPGYLLCDGGSYSTSTYANLFAVIGYRYGGSGANFNVPNMTNRFLKGVDTDFSGYTGGDSSNHTHNITPNNSVDNHSLTYPTYYNYRHYHYTAHQDGNCSSNMYATGGSHYHNYAGGALYELPGQWWGGVSAWRNEYYTHNTYNEGEHQHTNGYMAYGSYNFGNTATSSGDSDASCYWITYPALNSHTITNNTVTSVGQSSIPNHYRCYYYIKY